MAVAVLIASASVFAVQSHRSRTTHPEFRARESLQENHHRVFYATAPGNQLSSMQMGVDEGIRSRSAKEREEAQVLPVLAHLTCLRGGGLGGVRRVCCTDKGECNDAITAAVREVRRRWRTKTGRRWYVRVLLFCITARVPVISILRDEWAAVRLGTAAALGKQQIKRSLEQEVWKTLRKGQQPIKLCSVMPAANRQRIQAAASKSRI